jgi:hypothetical protein
VMSSKQMKPERWRRIETLYHAKLLREMDRDRRIDVCFRSRRETIVSRKLSSLSINCASP